MPVFVPYMISFLASLSSSMARQILMRSRALGANSTFSLSRAIATSFSMVRDDPSRMMGMMGSLGVDNLMQRLTMWVEVSRLQVKAGSMPCARYTSLAYKGLVFVISKGFSRVYQLRGYFAVSYKSTSKLTLSAMKLKYRI